MQIRNLMCESTVDYAPTHSSGQPPARLHSPLCWKPRLFNTRLTLYGFEPFKIFIGYSVFEGGPNPSPKHRHVASFILGGGRHIVLNMGYSLASVGHGRLDQCDINNLNNGSDILRPVPPGYIMPCPLHVSWQRLTGIRSSQPHAIRNQLKSTIKWSPECLKNENKITSKKNHWLTDKRKWCVCEWEVSDTHTVHTITPTHKHTFGRGTFV